MRALFRDLWVSLLMGLVVPWILLNLGCIYLSRPEKTIVFSSPMEAADTVFVRRGRVSLLVLLRSDAGEVAQMDMDSYLVGVVLAEMPASFETEALKAQAVVARTYARKAWITGGKHGDGSVCTQSNCCQAYRSEDIYLAGGGTWENLQKVQNAVSATSGCVLMYGGDLIEATYFSCSGGSTEDACAVWGMDFPYLRAVSSPGEEDALYYTDTTVFSPEEFARRLGISLSGASGSWISGITYTSGGGVDMMHICGKAFRGTELRSLLGLRSTAISIVASPEEVRITTRGFGHRVGMSQYGADAMAATGSTWEEILAHYYQGAEPVYLPSDETDREL